MRISDWSSDVCSSDLLVRSCQHIAAIDEPARQPEHASEPCLQPGRDFGHFARAAGRTGVEQDRAIAKHQRRVLDKDRVGVGFQRRKDRSEEHTSELQSLMRISYAVFCLKKKNRHTQAKTTQDTKKRNNRT